MSEFFNDEYFKKLEGLIQLASVQNDYPGQGLYVLCEITAGILRALVQQNKELRLLRGAVLSGDNDVELITERWNLLFKYLTEIGSRLPENEDPESRKKFFDQVLSPIEYK